MSVRPISRVGAAATQALRGSHGVSAAASASRLWMGSSSSTAGNTAGVGNTAAGGTSGTARAQAVTFKETLEALSAPPSFADMVAAAEAEAHWLDSQRSAMLDKGGAKHRAAWDLRERVEDALAEGASVTVGPHNGAVVRRARRYRAMLRGAQAPRGLLTAAGQR